MDIRDIRVENFKSYLKEKGGPASIARAHPDFDPSYASQLVNGHRKFGEKAARKMEVLLNLPYNYFDQALKNDNLEKNNNSNERTIHEVPMLSWVQAGDLCESFDIQDYNTAEEWRPCPVKHGLRTFVLQIRGDSMWPEYQDGTDIFVDPDISPRHNDDVIVITDDGKATFKRLKITNEGHFIEAINPDWPDRVKALPTNSRICGVVIYSGKPRR